MVYCVLKLKLGNMVIIGLSLNRRINQTLISPLLILAITALGFCLSTVAPKERQVPKTCLTVPAKFLAIDF